MGAEIDRLEVSIEASAKQADASLDDLVKKLEKLTGSLGRVSTKNIDDLSKRTKVLKSNISKIPNSFSRISKSAVPRYCIFRVEATCSAMAATS